MRKRLVEVARPTDPRTAVAPTSHPETHVSWRLLSACSSFGKSAFTVRPYLGENPGCASGHMSGAVVDLVCSDQLSRGLRAWQARSRHATGERIGDCDLMRSTSASCARQRWSGNARSMTSVKRAAGTALSVVVVLFDHHKSLRNHRDTRTLEQFAILSRTISVRHERRTSTQREAARTRANQSPVEKCTARTFMK